MADMNDGTIIGVFFVIFLGSLVRMITPHCGMHGTFSAFVKCSITLGIIHYVYPSSCSVTHILHVPNHNERTTEFRVESDLECVSGPSSLAITGGDVVDYPLLVRPIRRGVVSGAIAFVAQPPTSRDR